VPLPAARASFLAQRHLERRTPPASTPELPFPRTNRILASFPAFMYQRIHADLEHLDMLAGDVLYEAGCRVRHVYFPATAVVSLLSETASGATTEMYSVGNDGALGFKLLAGGERPCNRAVVLTSGHGYRLESRLLTSEITLSSPFLHAMLRHVQALITQTAQTAVCIRHHSLDQQLCRRLLLMLDRSPTRELAITHEKLARMLGVRRESITMAAGKLHAAAVIRNLRGRIEILDRHGMEARACECYGVVKREHDLSMTDGLQCVTRAA
jgi:CRP-like cAMP-binding protein